MSPILGYIFSEKTRSITDLEVDPSVVTDSHSVYQPPTLVDLKGRENTEYGLVPTRFLSLTVVLRRDKYTEP